MTYIVLAGGLSLFACGCYWLVKLRRRILTCRREKSTKLSTSFAKCILQNKASRKKPGVAFWAAVGLVVVLVGLPGAL